MIQIKFTPFILFLILLIVLVISILLGNRFMDRHFNKEGFIAFAQNKNPVDEVSIPQYSSTKLVKKLHDNLFFDSTNGNLIELDASAISGTSYDSNGTTINNVYVTERDGRDTIIYRANNSNLFNFDSSSTNSSETNDVIKQDTESSKINSMFSSYSTWLYNSNCLNTTKTNTFYSSWDTSTFITVFTNNGTQWNFTNNFHFANNSANVNSNISDPLFIRNFLPDTDTKNNTMVIDPLYDNSRQIYQLAENVKYDIQNGNLIIISNGAAKIYDRNKNIVTNSGGISVPNVSFNPWNIIDEDGQNYVIYMQNGTNTIIELVSFLDNTQSKLTLRNIKRFTPNGIINERGTVTPIVPAPAAPAAPVPAVPVPAVPVPAVPAPVVPAPVVPAPVVPAPVASSHPSDLSYNKIDSVISEYFKWYWYWKSSASANDDNSDYILKTQIVPPVCPSCPMCTGDSCSNSVCTNCGGNGGSGILDKSGISLFDASGNPTSCNKLGPYGIAYDSSKNRVICGVYDNKNNSETNTKKLILFDSTGKPTTCDTLGPDGIAYDNCGNIIMCKDVNSLSRFLNNTVDTVGDVTNKIIGGVENVAGDVVSTTGDVLKTVSKDFTGLLKNNPHQLQSSYRGNMNQPYYGANMNQPYYGANMNQQSYGTQNQTVDQYSYYGQLQSNGSSNFLPVTADFSAFG